MACGLPQPNPRSAPSGTLVRSASEYPSCRDVDSAGPPPLIHGYLGPPMTQPAAYPMVRSGVRAMSKRPICLAARLPVTPACPYVRT